MKLVLILLLCLLAHELKGTLSTEFLFDKYVAAAPDVTRVHLDLRDKHFREKWDVSRSHILKPNAGHTLSWRDKGMIPKKNMPYGVRKEKSYALLPDNIVFPDFKKRFLEIVVQRYRRRE
jgi:hypothetical protein